MPTTCFQNRQFLVPKLTDLIPRLIVDIHLWTSKKLALPEIGSTSKFRSYPKLTVKCFLLGVLFIHFK